MSSPSSSKAFTWAAISAVCLMAATAFPLTVAAQEGPRSFIERSPPVPPPKDDKAPDIPLEERFRRRRSPSKEVAKEDWYLNGKATFVAKCAGCHPAGYNNIDRAKSLYWDDLERNGYGAPPGDDITQIIEITRYGKGKMPGFAVDCPDKGEFTKCGVIVPLSEATLQDVEDFIVNRANAGWKGRG